MRIHQNHYYRGEGQNYRRSVPNRGASYYTIPARKSSKDMKNLPFPTPSTPTKKFRSRIVTVIRSTRKEQMGKETLKRRGNNPVKQRYLKKPHTFFEFVSKRPKHSLIVCPNAPHNTTSFLMNFHRDEILSNKIELDRSWTSEDDECQNTTPEFPCYSYGSFFGSLGDSYEVASQISAPQ